MLNITKYSIKIKDLNKRKCHVHGLEDDINMGIFLKSIQRFKATSIRLLNDFLNCQADFNIHMKF